MILFSLSYSRSIQLILESSRQMELYSYKSDDPKFQLYIYNNGVIYYMFKKLTFIKTLIKRLTIDLVVSAFSELNVIKIKFLSDKNMSAIAFKNFKYIQNLLNP